MTKWLKLKKSWLYLNAQLFFFVVSLRLCPLLTKNMDICVVMFPLIFYGKVQIWNKNVQLNNCARTIQLAIVVSVVFHTILWIIKSTQEHSIKQQGNRNWVVLFGGAVWAHWAEFSGKIWDAKFERWAWEGPRDVLDRSQPKYLQVHLYFFAETLSIQSQKTLFFPLWMVFCLCGSL